MLESGGEMVNGEIHPGVDDALYFAESVRHLWEATRQVVYGGIDTDDLAALCAIVVRVSERRLSHLQSAPRSSEMDSAIKQLQDSHDSAVELLTWAKAPTPEPDWSAVSARLVADGGAPLELHE